MITPIRVNCLVRTVIGLYKKKNIYISFALIYNRTKNLITNEITISKNTRTFWNVK